MLKDALEVGERGVCFLRADVLEDVPDLGDALVLEGSEGVYLWTGAYVLMVCVVVFDGLGTEGFYAGHCRAKVSKRLALVLETRVLD